VPQEVISKIALFTDVDEHAVIPLKTADTIYEVPLMLEEAGLGDYLAQHFSWPATGDLRAWSEMVEHIKTPRRSLEIALVGKYVDLHDSYMSIAEALTHAGLSHDVDVNINWVNSERVTLAELEEQLAHACGILVAPGFGPRGVEGKILASKYARERQIPYLGVCYGLHMAAIDVARNVLGYDGASSTEIDPESPHPVIDLMPDQKDVEMGGTMRLGTWPCKLVPGTKAAAAYGEEMIHERHRHRYEINNAYRDAFDEAGMIVSGASPDNKLAEIMELVDHPWFVGVQFHPEFQSRPTRPHPLFRDFVGAAKLVLREGDQRPLPIAVNGREPAQVHD
jgi:CTP synthase